MLLMSQLITTRNLLHPTVYATVAWQVRLINVCLFVFNCACGVRRLKQINSEVNNSILRQVHAECWLSFLTRAGSSSAGYWLRAEEEIPSDSTTRTPHRKTLRCFSVISQPSTLITVRGRRVQNRGCLRARK